MSERLKAAKALFTGRLPTETVIKEVIRVVDLRRGRSTPKKEAAGVVDISRRWTNEQPHPAILSNIDEINKDPELETAITVMTEMVASGFYTEMGEGVEVPKKPDGSPGVHPNKAKIDAWNEEVNADENISVAVRQMFEKGFSCTQLLPDEEYKLQVLPSETIYYWRKPTEAEAYKITQKVGGSTVNTWTGADLKDLIWLAHKATPSNPYGLPMAYSIEDFLAARRDMTHDGVAVLRKIGYPMRRWESQSKELMDKIYTMATNRDPDEDLFIDGVDKDELTVTTEETNARLNFNGFILANDQKIAEGLFSPLMAYLRNATEASATKMLEAIDRHVQGIQLYVKRRFEKYVFGRIVQDPIPRLVWGRPKSGVEQVNFADVAALYNGGNGCIVFDQAQDLIKKLGLPLKDIPEGQGPQPGPSLKDLPLLDQTRMTTLQASLNVIEENYKAKNIDIASAFREGTRVIKVHIEATKRDAIAKLGQMTGKPIISLSPESELCYTTIKTELEAAFRERLLPHGAHEHGTGESGRRFTVITH